MALHYRGALRPNVTLLVKALLVMASIARAYGNGDGREDGVLPRGSHVLAFHFFPQAANSSNSQVILSAPDPRSGALSVCFWLRQMVHVMPSDIVKIRFGGMQVLVLIKDLLLYVQPSPAMSHVASSISVSRKEWIDLCVTVTRGGTVLLFTSELNFKTNISSDARDLSIFAENSTSEAEVVLGGQNNQYFMGALADIRIYGKELTKEDQMLLNTCNTSLERMAYKIDGQTQLSKEGNVGQTLIRTANLCRLSNLEKDVLVVKDTYGNYHQILKFCSRIGGRLPSRQKDIIEDIIDDFFYSVSQNLSLNYFIYMQVDNTSLGCDRIEITIVSEYGYDYRNSTGSCAKLTYFAACLIPYNLSVNFLTDGTANSAMKPYVDRGQVYFISDKGAFLRHGVCETEPGISCLYYKSESMKTFFREMTNDDFLIGRANWIVESDTNNSIIATTTICNSTSFTCTSGHCIPLMYRCDGKLDCPDRSEEGTSCSRILPLSVEYRKEMCPELSSKPVIKMFVDNLEVNEVLMNDDAVQITLHTIITWSDPRLNFTGLLKNKAAQGSLKELESLWRPQLYLANGGYQTNYNLATRTSILEDLFIMARKSGFLSHHKSREGIVNLGEDVEINYETKFQYTFTCSFSFFAFPFDVQLCYMNFTLVEIAGSSCRPIWNKSHRIVSERSCVSMYEIEKLRYLVVDESNLIIYLLLERKYYSYMLTTFLPCVILCLLGGLTMVSFQIDDFTNRITVTVSLIIVVALLYSQIVTTLPTSPASKSVEIFFFYIIVRLAFVFILHTVVERVAIEDQIADFSWFSFLFHSKKSPIMSIAGRTLRTKSCKDTQSRPSLEALKKAHTVNKIGYIAGFIADFVITVVLILCVYLENYKKFDEYARALVYDSP